MQSNSKASETDGQEARKAASQGIGSRTAFQAALAKFQNLERGTKDSPQVGHCPAPRKFAHHDSLGGLQPSQQQQRSNVDLASSTCVCEPNKQQKLKLRVADRFAALVREGLEPNAAAARAILEAAGSRRILKNAMTCKRLAAI